MERESFENQEVGFHGCHAHGPRCRNEGATPQRRQQLAATCTHQCPQQGTAIATCMLLLLLLSTNRLP